MLQVEAGCMLGGLRQRDDFHLAERAAVEGHVGRQFGVEEIVRPRYSDRGLYGVRAMYAM